MLGSWLMWLTAGIVLTTLAATISSKSGQKWLRQQRSLLARKTVADTKAALRNRTPKARLRAEKRDRRKAEPPRLTFGHKRPPDDPSRIGQALRRATAGTRASVVSEVERVRVARANRKAERKAERRRNKNGLIEILTLEWEAERTRSQGLCGSTNTDDGHPCQNLRMIGQPRCQVHTPNSVA